MQDFGQKSRFLHTKLIFDAPIRGTPTEFCHNILCRETRMVGLSESEKDSGYI